MEIDEVPLSLVIRLARMHVALAPLSEPAQEHMVRLVERCVREYLDCHSTAEIARRDQDLLLQSAKLQVRLRALLGPHV